MSRLTNVRAFAGAVVLVTLSACGGGSDSSGPVSISFSTPPPASITIGTTATMAAAVQNDGSNAGVNWTVTCGSSDCGSFSTNHTDSGAATTYTPPATVPNPATVTITATAIADATQSVAASVTVNAASVPALADGTYVYHLSGSDSAGPYAIAGAFTVSAGAITGGEQDFSDVNAGYTDTIAAATSSLGIAPSGNIQVVLDTGNAHIGVNGIETLRGTKVSAQRVLLTEFDAGASASGSLDRQTSTAAPAGGYAFAVSGNDTAGEPLSIGGVLNFSGTALSVAGSVFDLSAFTSGGPLVYTNQSFSAGTISAPDAFGRVSVLLTPTANALPFGFAGYIVGTNRIEFIESGVTGDTFNANTGGRALGQGAATGTFSGTSASLSGQSYVLGNGGVDLNNPVVFAGPVTFNSDGTLSGTLAANDLTVSGAWPVTGTYTVNATGRVSAALSLATTTTAPPSPTLGFQFYLDGAGNAMVIGADAFQTTQGIAYLGGANTLSGTFALNGQGILASSGGGLPWAAVGPMTITSGAISGFTDYNSAAALNPVAGQALGGTVDSGNGILNITGLNGTDFTATTSFGYYGVSGNRTWGIEVDNGGVSLILLEPVTP